MFGTCLAHRRGSTDVTGYDDLQAMLGSGARMRARRCARTRQFAGGHAPGAINLPLSQFDPAKLPPGQGGADLQVGRALGQCAGAGAPRRHRNITHFAGGMGRWRRSAAKSFVDASRLDVGVAPAF